MSVVLGVSDSMTCGAALIVDGRIVAAVNEERLNRKKMCWGFPVLSINEVLRIAGVSPEDVDRVAVAGADLFWRPETVTVEDYFRNSKGGKQGAPALASTSCCSSSTFPPQRSGRGILANCREANANAWQSRARWQPILPFCSWMNRSARWMRSPVPSSGVTFAEFNGSYTRPCCWSRMTSQRRWR